MSFGKAAKILILFILFLIALFAIWTDGTNRDYSKSVDSTRSLVSTLQVRQNGSAEPIPHDEQDGEKIHYYPLRTLPIIFTRVISPSDIYAFSENSVIHFDGIKWDFIYSLSNARFSSADCDGQHLIFSADSAGSKSMTRPYVFVCRITRNKSGLNLSSPILLNVGISDQPNIFFTKPGSALLGGIMQLGFVELKDPGHGAKLNYHFNIYPSDAITYYGHISFCKATGDSSTFAYTSRYVAELRQSADGVDLERIIDLRDFCHDNSETDAMLDSPVLSFLNSSFGVIRSCNKLLVYSRRLEDSSATVNVITNPPLNPKDVRSICVTSSREFWFITTGGVLMRADRDDEKFNNWHWKKVGVIPDVTGNYLLTPIDSDKILAAGSSITIFSRKIISLDWEKGSTKGNSSSLFSLTTFSPATNYGVGIRDFNNDGFEDVVMANIAGPNQLYLFTYPVDPYMNNLEHYLVSRGLKSSDGISATSEYSEDVAVTSGDINEDGSEDVIMSSVSGHNRVYLNNGSGYFRDVTKVYGLNENLNRSEGVVLADVNNDGYLDLFETSFNGSNKLLLNVHGAFFRDVTASSGLTSRGSSITAVFSDVNGDGYPDLYIGNWGNQNNLYRNNGDGTFTDVTDLSGTGCGFGKKTNSVLFADFNNDGKPDLFVGNKGGGNRLFINEGNFHFKDVSRQSGVGDTMYSYGAVYGDFNNDGLLDLLVVGLGDIRIYQNLYIDSSGVPHFQNIFPQCALPQAYVNGYNTGAATFDLNNDGNLDVVVGQFNGRSFLLRNNFSNVYRANRRFIEAKVEGSESNRDGIGAKLFLYHNGKLVSFREVCSSYGYASSSSEIQHFGILDPEGKYELKAIFPATKIVRTIAVSPGKLVTVKEHSGIRESYYLWKKAIALWLYSGDLGEGTIHFLVFIGILVILGLFVKGPNGLTYLGSVLRLKTSKKTQELSSMKLAVLWVPAAVYILVSALVSLSRKAFMSNLIWMSGKDDFIMVDIFPLLLGLSSALVMVVIDRQASYRKVISKETVYKLFTGLKSFEHGEGPEMVLARLALFCKNLPTLMDSMEQGDSSSIDYIVERFQAALVEWSEIVRPELERIVSLCKLIEGKNLTDKFNGLSKNIRKSEATISEYARKLEKLYLRGHGIDRSQDLRPRLFSMYEEILRLRDNLQKSLEIVSGVFVSDVNKVARMVVNRFQDIAFSGIDIELNLSNETAFAVIDRVELFKVLETLVENAIQAFSSNRNFKESHLIRLSVVEADLEVRIAVQDNGPGLSEEQKDFVFRKGITTKGDGHGFGLIYAKEVIEKYGGTIYVDREYQNGARFIINLKRV